ncbi:MAG: trypsin-like peptidase domain-containing protein [Clostridia bacterium]|nr:trypsin-like peptidase domain-containing protein [Clostridia bacterium]
MQNNNTPNQGNSYSSPYSYTPNSGYGYQPAPTPPPEPPKDEKKGFSALTLVICIILSVVISTVTSVSVLLGVADEDLNLGGLSADNAEVNQDSENGSIGNSTNNGQSTTITIEGTVESIVEAVYQKASPSVVGIRTTASVIGFFGGSTESTGEGSGVIYSTDGYIITNYHVIQDVVSNQYRNASVEVFLSSSPNTPVEAKVIGYNVSADLAVIKISKTGLTPIEIANSDSVKIGQYAVAIGSPGGIEFLNSVSYGIISGLNRSITVESIGEMQLIQTDAAINPGNSGGALLNSKGQLIGINSSKLVDESFEGMGFAIPSNTAVSVVNNIINNKNTSSPYIGIEIYKYNSDYLAEYGLPAGAAVKSVVSGAPAYNAGIRAGDIITSFDGVEITEYDVFMDTLNKCTPGERVSARIYRNGRYYNATITIGSNN